MKKNLLILPLLGSVLLTSCASTAKDEKITLTFGTYATNDITKVKYGDLLTMMDDKESFIIATYESDDTGCSCWRTLEFNLKQLINEKHYNFYKIEYFAFGEDDDTLGLTVLRDRPALHFVKNGKVEDTFIYSTNNLNPLFKDKDSLLRTIQERCDLPNYYFMPAIKNDVVNDTIDTHINNDETFIACYYSDSCGDCKYVFPKLLYPYSQGKQFKIPMYLVNLDVKGVALDENGKSNKDDPSYQAFKDNHKLSEKGDATYGYNNGYVPTFHYYENGELKDACVYFNDQVVKENGQLKIKESFYSKKRQSSLHYLDNIETTVLENLTLKDEDVIPYKDMYFLKQDVAAKYHNPLLEAFLNKYAF